ncbi:MAG: hypothetical protein U5K29_00680 [Acidimicrobiales bacterium]|nr:hypothetical protein [Acidimicrobiales bacterium]
MTVTTVEREEAERRDMAIKLVQRTIELCERHGHDTSELEQRLIELRA